jgi:hypothetical protein
MFTGRVWLQVKVLGILQEVVQQLEVLYLEQAFHITQDYKKKQHCIIMWYSLTPCFFLPDKIFHK